MSTTHELPENVKWILVELESDSQQVVAQAIKSLDTIGCTDLRVIMALRKVAGEKRNWYIQVRRSAFNLADKLSQKAEDESLGIFLNGEAPDRELFLRILQIELELSRRQKAFEKKVSILFLILILLLIL